MMQVWQFWGCFLSRWYLSIHFLFPLSSFNEKEILLIFLWKILKGLYDYRKVMTCEQAGKVNLHCNIWCFWTFGLLLVVLFRLPIFYVYSSCCFTAIFCCRFALLFCFALSFCCIWEACLLFCCLFCLLWWFLDALFCCRFSLFVVLVFWLLCFVVDLPCLLCWFLAALGSLLVVCIVSSLTLLL